MAYTPTVWENGDVITAEKLNKAENGIAAAAAAGIVPLSFTYGEPVYNVPSATQGYVPVTLSLDVDASHIYSVASVPDFPDIGTWYTEDDTPPSVGLYYFGTGAGEEGGLVNLSDGVSINYTSDYGYIIPISGLE